MSGKLICRAFPGTDARQLGPVDARDVRSFSVIVQSNGSDGYVPLFVVDTMEEAQWIVRQLDSFAARLDERSELRARGHEL